MQVLGCAGVPQLLFLLLLHSVTGNYVITTPRKWTAGSKAQVCMAAPEMSQQDSVTVTLYSQDEPNRNFGGGFWGPFRNSEPTPEVPKKLLIPAKVLKPHGDGPMTCDQVTVPETTSQYGQLTIVGQLGGATINETRDINFANNVQETYIQTDKYLYKAGQKVQFRVLTLQGPFFGVSTLAYPEIFVKTPSGSRIAQWLDVANPSGLIHLELQLIEEPEEGVYDINVRSPLSDMTVTQRFKIEDYVLPRFEVTLKPPNYLLADAEILKFEVCATYTFGQPVKGNVSLLIENNGWGKYKVDMTFNEQLFGCKKLEIPLRSFDINGRNFFVYSLNLKVKVEEEGTGNTVEEKTSVQITRTVITMQGIDTSAYKKPELPHISKVKAEFPDGSPAVREPMSVCVQKACRNLTTDSNGVLHFIVPPHLHGDNAEVKAINYPPRSLPGEYSRHYMYESQYYTYSNRYFSPSNSSLIINPDSTKLECSPGESMDLKLPVLYAAVNMTGEVTMYIQIISRGQIQFWDAVPVTLTGGALAIDEATLVAPMEAPVSSFTVRGTVTIPVTLPNTVSPTVKVLVWYNRPDGEVVSDTRELEVSKCLEHRVKLSWPLNKVEQGTVQPLTLTAEPNSLCSLGIVDKSVELLSRSQDSLTLDRVFDLAERAAVSSWENSQINDYDYCRRKNSPKESEPEDGPPSPPGPIPVPLPALPEPELIPMDEPATGGVINEGNLEAGAKPPQLIPTTLGGGASVASSDAEGADKDKERAKRSFFRPYFGTNFVDALKMFDESGLYVITDLTTETRPCHAYAGGFGIYNRVSSPGAMRPMFAMNAGMPGLAAAATPHLQHSPTADRAHVGPTTESNPRVYFPETWLWQLAALQESGNLIQELTLPNTITEWVGRAVCVHPSKGLGLSGPSSITTFTPFFIDLTILPTVKKGEIMPIKISVFNYLEASLPVSIILESSDEYEILESTGTKAAENQAVAGAQSACIPTQDKTTVVVRVRPLRVGSVNVTVTAGVDPDYPHPCGPDVLISKQDRIISPIIVEYEGFPREKTWTKYMCSEDLNENTDSFEEWRLEAPAEIVEESERAWVTVVGDLLGPTLENLGGLIRMPYGCGEQNMLNFAPNIYVLQYLEASKQSNEKVHEKITNFMKSGYQRELNYKHSDGSYSAFGKSDDSGSTWLTAFVVKSFAQARQYISVDATELNMSADWLKGKQLENGCFESVGKVLHKAMKGGLAEGDENPSVLTAYVMAALLEAGEDPESKATASAVFCLDAAAKKNVEASPYELAVKAYALSLARFPTAEKAIADLLSVAVDSPTGLYWKIPDSKGGAETSGVSAVAVETAGYALLALMHKDPEEYKTQGHRLVKWISAQRNGQGGFISTQDTVIALQALAVYESHQSQELLELDVAVTGQDLAAHFKLEERNKLVSQRAEVKVVPNTLTLDMAGTGCTLIQGVVRYNVKNPEPSEAFSLSVSTSLDYSGSCKGKKIRTCASYLLNDQASNMAVIEVTLVSGYIPDKQDLKRIVGYGMGNIKRYEVDGSKVLFYVDQFTAKETCVEFVVLEEVEVDNAKPGTVKVYDYYQPEFFVTEKYELPRRWFCETRPVVILAEETIVPFGGEGAEAPVANQDVDDLLGALDELP